MKLKNAALAFFLLCLLGQNCIYAQTRREENAKLNEKGQNLCILKGQVVNADNGDGIPFAALLVQGYNIGVACDEDGYYEMELPQTGDYKIIVRSTGYKEQIIDVFASKPELNKVIMLSSDILGLDEIVVTGTRNKKTLANTPVLTQIITSTQLLQNDFENITDALEYTIPGLQFKVIPGEIISVYKGSRISIFLFC